MKQSIAVSVVLFAVFTTSAARALDARDFFKGVEGQYTIQTADGIAPKPENSLAEVFVDKDEVVLTLPFCSKDGSFCDPGYLFLSDAQTTVEQKQTSEGLVTTITVSKSPAETYIWTQRASDVRFQNPQYTAQGRVWNLEHVLVKNAP